MRFIPGNLVDAIRRHTFVWIAAALVALLSANPPGICGLFTAPGLCDSSTEEDDDIQDAHLLTARSESVGVGTPAGPRASLTLAPSRFQVPRSLRVVCAAPLGQNLSPRLRC